MTNERKGRKRWEGWLKTWQDSATICKLSKREKSERIPSVFTEMPRESGRGVQETWKERKGVGWREYVPDIVVNNQPHHFFLRHWRLGSRISQIGLPSGFYAIWKAKYKEKQEQMADKKFAAVSEQAPFGAIASSSAYAVWFPQPSWPSPRSKGHASIMFPAREPLARIPGVLPMFLTKLGCRPCTAKCGSWASSISIPWDLVGNSEFPAPLQTYWI